MPPIIDAFFEFFDQNKAFFSGLSIALATIIAVLINYRYSRKLDKSQKNEKIASFATAIASELIDNTDNLINLYLEMTSDKPNTKRIGEYHNFQKYAYETIFTQIGNMGSDLSFMIVDVYGDLNKLSARVEYADKNMLAGHDEEFMSFIQAILAKALTTSIVIFMYADYLQGPEYCKEVKNQRKYWIERNLYAFCKYAAEADEDLDFVAEEEQESLDFVKRFPNKEDRIQIRNLMNTVDSALANIIQLSHWRAQLAFKALAYKIQNTLTHFLQFEIDPYQEQLEQEMSKYLNQ